MLRDYRFAMSSSNDEKISRTKTLSATILKNGNREQYAKITIMCDFRILGQLSARFHCKSQS